MNIKSIITLSIIILLTGCQNNIENKEEYQESLKDITIEENELSKNISCKEYKGLDDSLILEITNNNTKTIRHLVVDIDFFDEQNKKICTDSKYTFFLDYEETLPLSFNCDKMNQVKNYDIKFVVEENFHSNLASLENDIYLTDNAYDTTIYIQVENKTAPILTKSEIIVTFYRDSQIVATNKGIVRNISKGETKLLEIKIPTVNNEPIDYSAYSVKTNYAY